MEYNLFKKAFWLLAPLFAISSNFYAQGSWQLWASGLPAGSYPKLAVAPNHDLFYCLVGTGGPKGIIHKANTQGSQGNFVPLPAVPLPASSVNNINALETNQLNEPIAGIFRNNATDPWLFRFDQASQQWMAANVDLNPTLGAFCMARSPNGALWAGAKWAYVYKSTDNGHTFTHIDESAIVKANFPCYYPSWSGYEYDGAIYGINVDKNGRVYAGTESAGMVYSNDEGITWQPADYHPCKDTNPIEKDSISVMKALSIGGNCAGIGFSADNKLVWCGANMWALGWQNELGLADIDNHTVTPCLGFPAYLVQLGQQVSKIVTAANGQMFLHSGGNAAAAGIGIYTSMDGELWTAFNNGITGANDNQSQGSLAVDSNMVFMATHDGKVWRYVLPDSSSVTDAPLTVGGIQLFPNPAFSEVQIWWDASSNPQVEISIFDFFGRCVVKTKGAEGQCTVDASALHAGVYYVEMVAKGLANRSKLVIQHK